jgi:hypothetical protein
MRPSVGAPRTRREKQLQAMSRCRSQEQFQKKSDGKKEITKLDLVGFSLEQETLAAQTSPDAAQTFVRSFATIHISLLK